MFSFETPEHHVIVTASSDGFIKMWKLEEDKVSVSAQCQYARCKSPVTITLSEGEFFFIERPHLWHMEVPRPEVESKDSATLNPLTRCAGLGMEWAPPQ